MTTEVFYPRKNNESSFMVEVVHTDMLTDIMTVLKDSTEYTLSWNPNRSMYEGDVKGLNGYML
jgi:hypothetical protein